jgi:SMP-30/Gluconolactonase/LRE-like region
VHTNHFAEAEPERWMKLRLSLVILAGAVFAGVVWAQRSSQPALLPCGAAQGNVEILCGTHAPEDLEPTPDGKYLIVSQFTRVKNSDQGEQLALFDLATKAFSRIPVSVAPDKAWGDHACPGPIGDGLVAHGISLEKRTNGVMELYAINHNRRESMEMFELKRTGGSWGLIWHGCEISSKEFNDVAALPDGGFIASHPTSLMNDPKDEALRYSGKPIGTVVRWTQAKGEEELPGTRVGYPNGVVVSADGRYMYLDAWTAREVHKYDLMQQKDVQVIKVDFMPDNLAWVDKSWAGARSMLAAGVKGVKGDCPDGTGHLCIQQFGVAEIDPATMKSRVIYESQPSKDAPLIAGASVAVQVGNAIYIGSYTGDRLVKITLKNLKQ